MRLACLALLLVVLPACPHRYKRSYPEPEVKFVLDHLDLQRAGLTSFKTDSVMDYWVGDDRFKGTVYVMGTIGSRVRMNALKPDDTVAADLACDGDNFVFVDQMNNCVLTGPCTAESIAQLLRVPLAPDDFLYLALGATPVIPNATGKLHWDKVDGHEVIELDNDRGQHQTIVLDGKGGIAHWDVLKSILKEDGKVVWQVEHKGYAEKKDVNGEIHRIPAKTIFKTPSEKSDLLVTWGTREVGLELGDEKFELIPPDVKMCGEK